MNGMPGPYIKWFLEKCGHSGLNKMLDGFDDRSCYAQTIVTYCAGEGEIIEVFEGRTNGRIVEARGSTEFGWDAIFECDEGGVGLSGKTYGEMSQSEKNSVSHRGKAMSEFKKFLSELD